MAKLLGSKFMAARDAKHRRLTELRNELARLMEEQLESLKSETFVGRGKEQFREQDQRLNRIREVSADLLALLSQDSD
jgi:hypothetical protein